MARVKRGTIAHKRRKNVLKKTKGFRWGRKSKYRQAKEALQKAGTYAYRDRRVKKREARKLWQTQINNACHQNGLNYSRFLNKIRKNKVELDRKVLAQLAKEQPETFKKIIEKVK